MVRGLMFAIIMVISINPSASYKEKIVESLGFTVAILLGNGALQAHKSRKRVVKSKELALSFVIAMFVGFIVHIAATNFEIIKWRIACVALGAFLSEFILKWLESRSPKIFDSAFKKATGIDLNDNNSSSNTNNSNNNQNDNP